jgi:hypothetical protein
MWHFVAVSAHRDKILTVAKWQWPAMAGNVRQFGTVAAEIYRRNRSDLCEKIRRGPSVISLVFV